MFVAFSARHICSTRCNVISKPAVTPNVVQIRSNLEQPSAHTRGIHIVSGFAATVVVQADSLALTVPHRPHEFAEDMHE